MLRGATPGKKLNKYITGGKTYVIHPAIFFYRKLYNGGNFSTIWQNKTHFYTILTTNLYDKSQTKVPYYKRHLFLIFSVKFCLFLIFSGKFGSFWMNFLTLQDKHNNHTLSMIWGIVNLPVSKQDAVKWKKLMGWTSFEWIHS
jgi:hypothetical protein